MLWTNIESRKSNKPSGKHAVSLEPTRTLNFFIFLVLFGSFATGCVTSKAFKQSASQMKDSSANLVSTVEQWGNTNRTTTRAILDSELSELRSRILDEGKAKAAELAAVDRDKMRKSVQKLSTAPAGVPPQEAYSDVEEIVADSLKLLLSSNGLPDLSSEVITVADDTALIAAANQCIAAAGGGATKPGEKIPWRIYATQISCERVRDHLALESNARFQEYKTVATEVKAAGEAVNSSVQAAWDSDDVLQVLDLLNDTVGLAALAIAIEDRD